MCHTIIRPQFRLRASPLVITPPEPVYDARHFIGLAIAARILRLRGRKADNVRDLRHWARAGWTLPGDDVPVVLQTVCIDGQFMTTRQWCDDFADAKWEAYRRREFAQLRAANGR